jgi:4-hydroxy-2-oxoglutarate aldolase
MGAIFYSWGIEILMIKLTGIYPAITTPFDHHGEIYRAKIRHNVEKWNLTTVAGYLVCGLAGEGPLLSEAEKEFVWGEVAQFASGRTLIADCSAESVRQSLRLATVAAGLGYAAVLLRAPQMPGADAQLYFQAVADQSKLPVLAESAAPLAHPNILTGTWTTEATTLASSLRAGISAALIPYAAAAPFSAITIFEANLKREYEAAQDWQQRLLPVLGLLERYGVAALKYAMDWNGYYGGIVRLPLRPLPVAARQEIESALHGLRG